MPGIEVQVSNLAYTAFRPIALGAVRDVMRACEISAETPISFGGPDLDGRVAQPGSLKDLDEQNRFPYDERVFIEVDIDYTAADLYQTTVARYDQPPVLSDEVRMLHCAPVISRTKMTISFRYRAIDQNQAIRWRNMMRSKQSQLRDHVNMELQYSYCIPDGVITVLSEVWRMTQSKYPTGQDWNDYFTSIAYRHVGAHMNPNGEQSIWVVNRKETGVQGYFDFDSAPEKVQRDGENDNWIGTFSMFFEFDCPTSMYLYYPYVIHQQLIGKKYRMEPVLDPYNNGSARSMSMTAFQRLEDGWRTKQRHKTGGLSIPSFDDFSPQSVLYSSIRIFTALVLLSEETPNLLFNLKELGSVCLKQEVLDILSAGEYVHVGVDYRSLFSLCLYKGRERQPSGSVSLNANLTVVSNVVLDPRCIYHVRFGLVTNIDYIGTPSLIRISGAPASRYIAGAIYNGSAGMNLIRDDIKPHGPDSRELATLTGGIGAISARRGYGAYTVQDLFVTGSR